MYYLAGPMQGYPKFNFPMFHSAATWLRDNQYDVISPAEQDSMAVQEESMMSKDGKFIDGKVGGETWGDLLSRDVKLVADGVKGLILLPGWHKSKGARLEAYVGLLCKHEFLYYIPEQEVDGNRVYPGTHSEILERIMESSRAT
jgi:hypothetical protein